MKRNGLLVGYGCVFPFSYFTSNGSFYTFFIHSFIFHSAANLILLDKVQNVMMIKSMYYVYWKYIESKWTLVVCHFCLRQVFGTACAVGNTPMRSKLGCYLWVEELAVFSFGGGMSPGFQAGVRKCIINNTHLIFYIIVVKTKMWKCLVARIQTAANSLFSISTQNSFN